MAALADRSLAFAERVIVVANRSTVSAIEWLLWLTGHQPLLRVIVVADRSQSLQIEWQLWLTGHQPLLREL